MINIIKKHPIRSWSIFVLVCILTFLVFLKNKFNLDWVKITSSEEQQEFLFVGLSLNNWGFIITIIGAILGVPWALHQYKMAKRVRQQEKAAKIANQFAENLIDDTTIIGEVLKRYDKLTPIYKKINFKKLKRFDIYELEQLSGSENLANDFNEIIKSEEINNYFHYFIKNNFPEKNSSKLLKTPFHHYFIKTLNKLEAISIDISSNAAGTEYLYPSLHQALLPFIERCSIYISGINGNYTFKYFINLIDVYNNWKKIRQKEIIKEIKQQQKINIKTEKYNKKIQNLKDKALEKKPRKF